MEHIVIDGQEFDLNKSQIITISTTDDVTWKIICCDGVEFLTTDSELIQRLLN